MRRKREPFVVITNINSRRRREVSWNFSIKDVEKSFEKRKLDVISIEPYPNQYHVSIACGDAEIVKSVEAQTEDDVRKQFKDQKIEIRKLNHIFLDERTYFLD